MQKSVVYGFTACTADFYLRDSIHIFKKVNTGSAGDAQ